MAKTAANLFEPSLRPDAGHLEFAPVWGGAVMEKVLLTAARAAARASKVLITGETGVGKDLIARYIHRHSDRAARGFVAVNCGGLSETLLESELFGHVKGSFTGAYRDKIGKLQQADRGTIFLDEVAEMTPRMQALMLRFLETGEVHPVGTDTAPRRVDARVITATNRDLPRMVNAGTFREDLLYRVRVVEIHVPPLRQRPGDVRALLEYFLNKHSEGHSISEAATVALERYPWPGNVRELQNLVEQLVSLTTRDVIELNDLPSPIRQCAAIGPVAPGMERRRAAGDQLFARMASGTGDFWKAVYEPFMARDLTRSDLKSLITRALEATEGNYREVLALFGMPPHDYKRFLNFLVRHDCAADFRPYRRSGRASAASAVVRSYPSPAGG
jgi:transcriptional regulator with PAS, ATPase and Fis domain